jgi:hypothetical protein
VGNSSAQSYRLLASIVAFICTLAAFLFWLPKGRADFRRRFPVFLIHDDGLALNRFTVNNLPTQVIVPWAAFGAWTVQELRRGGKGYTLYAPNTRLYWEDDGKRAMQVPDIAGDLHAAYRDQLARMHATIAARTGLTLREERDDL